MTFRLVASIAALILALGGAAARADAPPSGDKGRGKIVAAFMDMVANQKKVAEAFAKYVGPTYRQHNPFAADGKEAAIQALSGWLKTVPDLHIDIKHVLVDGDYVALHYHLQRTKDDRGSAVVDLFRFDKGKIVEHWDVIQQVPETSANDNTMF
jgi:predicted SnoaL-like aldol condensation-catalyzing enzyme